MFIMSLFIMLHIKNFALSSASQVLSFPLSLSLSPPLSPSLDLCDRARVVCELIKIRL